MNRTEKLERLLDLKIMEASYGLSREESAELKGLVSEFPEWEGDESLELTAASIQLAGMSSEAMPAHLMESIGSEFSRLYPGNGEESQKVAKSVNEKIGIFDTKWLGWSLAGAFGALLLFNMFSNTAVQDVVDQTPPAISEQQQLSELVNSSTDLVRNNWESPSPEKPLEFEGEVVWSESKQQGFMRFKGLPLNDKAKETYQLWIFDENQKAETPVDGGIFDSETGGELIVPIKAKLEVKNAQMFAITVEKPGGVVVSDREKLIGLAKIKSKA